MPSPYYVPCQYLCVSIREGSVGHKLGMGVEAIPRWESQGYRFTKPYRHDELQQ